jgi:glucose-6-phosphate isomerase
MIMPKKIVLDYSYVLPFIKESDIEKTADEAFAAMDTLFSKSGAGNDYLGWLDLPERMLDSDELTQILETGNQIYKDGDLLVCIGIGGSYLGGKAVTEALLHPFYNMLDKKERKGPRIIFVGHAINGRLMDAVIDEIDRSESVYVNVVSKSGTTTETGIAFRLIQQKIEKKYGRVEASKRIIATTDANKGALRSLSDKEGYQTFAIPDDVGGRFSVMTPVGLLPIAAVGINVTKLLQGAVDAAKFGKEKSLSTNPAAMYAVIRNLLLRAGYHTEILVNYEPSLHYLNEWWKQLYGESEGKDGKGIFPAAVDFTTDLHSMGQWIQDGQRFIFETTVAIEETTSSAKVPSDNDNLDKLEYLAGETYTAINNKAMNGTLLAHYEGNVPNLVLKVPAMEPFYLGQLLYMFEEACGISGYMLGVNPFNQPGVEAYKSNMFSLLNKPGYEDKKADLDKKMESLPSGKQTT